MSNLVQILDKDAEAKKLRMSDAKSDFISKRRSYLISLIEEKNKSLKNKISYRSFATVGELESICIDNGISVEYPKELKSFDPDKGLNNESQNEESERVKELEEEVAVIRSDFEQKEKEVEELREFIVDIAMTVGVPEAESYVSMKKLAREINRACKQLVKSVAKAKK